MPADHQDSPDKASTKDRILDIAIEEFSRKGFAAARIDTIAQRAHANKQLIYYYFDSKYGMYSAALDRLVETYRPLWARLQNASVEDMITMRATHAADVTRWRRLLAWEGMEYWDSDDHVIHREDIRSQAYHAQTAAIERAQREGLFSDAIEPAFASLLLLYSTLGPIAFPQITKMVTGLDPTDPQLQAGITNALLSVVRGFAKAQEAPDPKQDPGPESEAPDGVG